MYSVFIYCPRRLLRSSTGHLNCRMVVAVLLKNYTQITEQCISFLKSSFIIAKMDVHDRFDLLLCHPLPIAF